jgi:HK97 family phage major capsid protein
LPRNNSAVIQRNAIRYSEPISTPAVILKSRPPRQTIAPPPPAPPRLAPVPAAPAAPHEFSRFADYLRALIRAAADQGVDTRLQRAPTGLNEADPTAGGFLVPKEFSEQLVASLYEQAVIAPLCTRQETAFPGRELMVPGIDETSRGDNSRWGGVLSYWLAEGPSVTTKFPRFRQIALNSQKIIAIAYGVTQLVEDAPAFESHMRRALGSELGFQLDNCILKGTGAGQPLGITNATATISVAKETGQGSATLVFENLGKMWSRLPAPCRRRAVWLINEDIEEQLGRIYLTVGAAGVSPHVYKPAGAFGVAEATLYGRPLVTIEQAPVIGTLGDIVLADLSQYMILSGPLQGAMSGDVAFLSDEIVFRFVWRVDGKPLWASAITPFNGGSTRSPFVSLAAR